MPKSIEALFDQLSEVTGERWVLDHATVGLTRDMRYVIRRAAPCSQTSALLPRELVEAVLEQMIAVATLVQRRYQSDAFTGMAAHMADPLCPRCQTAFNYPRRGVGTLCYYHQTHS